MIDKLQKTHIPAQTVQGVKIKAMDILTDPSIQDKINEIIDIIWKKGLDLEPGDVEVDPTTGHDVQCNIGIAGHECDCWRNPQIRETARKGIEMLRDSDHCPMCHCLYDDKMKGAQGRDGSCECSCGHKSPKHL